MNSISKVNLLAAISVTLSNPGAVLDQMDNPVSLPDDLEQWLGRLKLLNGVPYNYLVPDERMLPPESIRFFYVDMNWVDAILDGAYSIGRNLSDGAKGSAHSLHMDAATQPRVAGQINDKAGAIRAAALGSTPAPLPPDLMVSGFLLRSEVVQHYPGLGVNAFLKGQTPDDTDNPTLMTILRFERLGMTSDTLLCLLLGDAFQIEIHEAPEQLHYGIDLYETDPESGAVKKAEKALRIFTKTGDQVHIDKETAPVTLQISDTFRDKSPRTIKITELVEAMRQKLQLDKFNSAEFGLEMTEGVGNVKFIRSDPGDPTTPTQ